MFGRKVIAAAALGAVLALSGCAGGYSTFYQPTPLAGVVPRYEGEPQIRAAGADTNSEVLELASQGYSLIGTASFNGTAQSRLSVTLQAKKVGASLVLTGARYTNTINSTLQLQTPTSSTTYSNGQATVTGYGGVATGNYRGSSTTYGTQTTNVPISIARYDQMALFFAPTPHTGIGLTMANIPANAVAQYGTAQGAIVKAVVRGSPAFKADVLPGDLITTINGVRVSQYSDMGSIAAQANGGPLVLGIRRGEKTVSLTIQPGIW